MKIPTFLNTQWVENEYLTDSANMFHDELNRVLQGGLSDNGWTLPQQDQATITSISGDMPNGSMWYDTTNHEFVIKINGALRKVTTTAWP